MTCVAVTADTPFGLFLGGFVRLPSFICRVRFLIRLHAFRKFRRLELICVTLPKLRKKHVLLLESLFLCAFLK